MGSLGEMVCDGGMIAVVSYSSMGLLVFFHKLHWYNGFVMGSISEMVCHL